jgi:hypothetical protein
MISSQDECLKEEVKKPAYELCRCKSCDLHGPCRVLLQSRGKINLDTGSK